MKLRLNHGLQQTTCLKLGLLLTALSMFAACQLRFEDTGLKDPTPHSRTQVHVSPHNFRLLGQEEHPFSPQFLGPSFSLVPVTDSQERWSYQLSYLGQLQTRALSVSWDDTFLELDPSRATGLTFSCDNSVQHKLTIRWSSLNESQEKSQSFDVICPQNFDLRRNEDEKRFARLVEQAPDESAVIIGYLTLPSKRYAFNIKQKHLSLWIYQLRSPLDEAAPEWQFRLNPEAFPDLISTLKDLHLRSEWQRLEKEYPYFTQIVPELKQRYQSSFTNSIRTIQEITPQLYIYIHKQRGHLKLVSQSSTGPAPIAGAELAPDFYKNVISQAAPSGAAGYPGAFKIEDRSDISTCAGRAFDGITQCESHRTYCVVVSLGTPGGPGQPGTIPGIPGLNGFPAIPGPQIFVDTGELVADSLVDVAFQPAAEASKGGAGSPGQPGGAGGQGGAQTCKFDGNKLVPDKRFPDGAHGAPAPTGSQGKEGSRITCVPISLHTTHKAMPESEPSKGPRECESYRRALSQPHYVTMSQQLKTRSWINPSENPSHGLKTSYESWRRGLWLMPDFFKDSYGQNPYFLPEDVSPTENSAIRQYQEHTGTDTIGPLQAL